MSGIHSHRNKLSCLRALLQPHCAGPSAASNPLDRWIGRARVSGSPASLLAGVNDPTLRYNFFHWVLGFTLVYAMLFGVGDLLFGRVAPGCGLLALSGSCLAVLFYSLNRRGWSVWR